MSQNISRRDLLKAAVTAPCVAALPLRGRTQPADRWIRGRMSGAQALVEALVNEGAECVFGIPGGPGKRAVGHLQDQSAQLSAGDA